MSLEKYFETSLLKGKLQNLCKMVVYADRTLTPKKVIRNYWCREKCHFNKSCTPALAEAFRCGGCSGCSKMWRVLLHACIASGIAAVVVVAQPSSGRCRLPSSAWYSLVSCCPVALAEGLLVSCFAPQCLMEFHQFLLFSLRLNLINFNKCNFSVSDSK